ncbi:uncharacterized protein CBL_01283 [Carabus blaptoides fortunei]
MFNTIGGVQRYSKVTATATYLGLLLLSIQSFRRLHDTHFVSIFGKYSRINLTHYILGFIHYTGGIIAILAEAPNFTIHNAENTHFQWSDLSCKDIFATMVFLWAWWQQYKATKILANLRKNINAMLTEAPNFTIHNAQNTHIQWSDLSYKDIFGTMLFLWAWWQQYKATILLANLRKDINGKKISDEHHMPEGDLFEYVSSPHMLAEILMYASLAVILWENSTWWYVFLLGFEQPD